MEADSKLMTITAPLTSYLVRPRQCQPVGKERDNSMLSIVRHLKQTLSLQL